MTCRPIQLSQIFYHYSWPKRLSKGMLSLNKNATKAQKIKGDKLIYRP